MSRLLLLIALAIIVWYGLRWWKTQKPQARNKSLTTYALWGIAAVLILLTITGRAHWITGAIGALLPLIKSGLPYLARYIPMALRFRQKQAPQQLVGRCIRLRVNPLNGTVDGIFLDGPLKAQQLSALSESELEQGLSYCLSQEMKSAQLMAVFLQQQYGENWQQSFRSVLASHAQNQQSFGDHSQTGSLSLTEAREVLGVAEDATKEEIQKAYKSLMQKVHPDRGGNDFLSRMVSEAKDVLLKQFK